MNSLPSPVLKSKLYQKWSEQHLPGWGPIMIWDILERRHTCKIILPYNCFIISKVTQEWPCISLARNINCQITNRAFHKLRMRIFFRYSLCCLGIATFPCSCSSRVVFWEGLCWVLGTHPWAYITYFVLYECPNPSLTIDKELELTKRRILRSKSNSSIPRTSDSDKWGAYHLES